MLALIGLHLDHHATTQLLESCLLTDAELADGFDAWRTLPDPFAGSFQADLRAKRGIAASHPFWTGKRHLTDTAGRVEKFRGQVHP